MRRHDIQYSNLGLTLAGEVVSARSGKSYEQFVRERILDPLDLDSTYPEIPLSEKGKRLAQGFSARRRDGTRTPLPIFQTRGIAPAAGFASTVNDLARFAMWQLRARDAKSDPVLDPRSWRTPNGVNTGRYAKVLYDIVAPTVKKSDAAAADPAAAAAAATAASLAMYAGSYDAFPWDGESVIVVWGDGLATIDLPTTEPMKDLERLRKTGEHTFRRMR